MKNLRAFICGMMLLLAACQPGTVATTTAVSATKTLAATGTPAPSGTPAITTTPTLLPFAACSPLQGFNQADLLARISNPFDPPAPGSDNPHQGVDLSDFDPADPNRVAVAGRTVQAALPGTVALIQTDRFPYGTAVIVETPLEALPVEWQAQFGALEAWPALSTTNPLTCPQATSPFERDGTRRSLYVLYAHLGSTADLRVGDEIECGQTLGALGQSGNALAPHLHFEARVGPAGARLGSLAHYDVSASLQEMAAYCEWRVSGTFIWVDPRLIIDIVR